MSRPSVPSWCFSTLSRLHDGAHAAEPGDVAFARHTRVALVVPSGRGLRTGGDARIRGKEQPAGSPRLVTVAAQIRGMKIVFGELLSGPGRTVA
jgi:hypothetical protein